MDNSSNIIKTNYNAAFGLVPDAFTCIIVGRTDITKVRDVVSLLFYYPSAMKIL
ncbi:MAG TPA: hypothetical protein VE818_14280 [Nitrososphaeraceae archaeon]|nr:hypothetical protein [Nitrososphaeraceae archaeon]